MYDRMKILSAILNWKLCAQGMAELGMKEWEWGNERMGMGE